MGTGKVIRVLHVLDQLSVSSGASNVVMGYSRNINKFAIDVVVHKPSDKVLIEEIESRGGKVHQLPDITIPTASQYRKGFSKILDSHNYEIIHGHMPSVAFLFLKEARRKNVPHRIIHAHSCGTESHLKRARNRVLESLIPLYANHYYACSTASADYIYRRKTRGKVKILPNAIEPKHFRYSQEVRETTRKLLGIKTNELCIGHVGRFAPIKNHLFLLKAFSELLRSIPESRLVMVGGGPLLDKVALYAQDLGIGQRVIVLGEQAEIYNFYQAFDQFWLPSFFEGWCLAALEAQCSGLPCILSKAVPEAVNVTEGQVHYLELDSPTKWAEKSISLCGHLRRDGTQAIYKHNLDIKSQISILERLYESMGKERGM